MRPTAWIPLWPFLFLAVGCETPDSPAGPASFDAQELAKFMGTRAERAKRAPYSPEGWPLQRGDVIPYERKAELAREFPSVCGLSAPFWVGDMGFTATWSMGSRYVGDQWDSVKLADRPIAYLGHVRHYVWGVRCHTDDLPPHLRDRDPEVLAPPADMKVWHMGGDRATTAVWTRERWLDGYTGRGP